MTLKTLIDDFANELYKEPPDTYFQKIVDFDEDYVLHEDESGFSMKVKGLLVGGHYSIEKIHNEIKGEDHVWLVMQSVFDKRTMIISPTGEISVKD